MSTQTLSFETFAFADYNNQSKNDHSSSIVDLTNIRSRLFCKVPTDKDLTWGMRKITSVSARIRVATFTAGTSEVNYEIAARSADSPVDVAKLTYSNMPGTSGIGHVSIDATGYVTIPVDTYPSYSSRKIFDNGVAFFATVAPKALSVYTPSGSYAPALLITISDSELVSLEAPMWDSGWGGHTITRNAAEDITMGIYATPGSLCYDKLTQTGLSAIWRTGVGAEEHEIAMADGAAKKITIPANTFAGLTEVQIRPRIVTNGVLAYTPEEWCTVKLTDATPSAVPLSPNGDVIATDAAVVLKWRHVIPTGTTQTKADLQYSADGLTWADLATVVGAAETYTVQPGTFATGKNYWRVRTYNTDGIASEWSEAAQFVCIGAPSAPTIFTESESPRPSISWQASDQLAYQVEIDGVYTSGTYYGTDKQWTAPLYLADGTYTIRVRVQNEYALWSPWGAAAVQIVNTPGSAIALDVSTDTAARLAWSTTGAYDYFLIYRDGQLVAKTTEASYVDNMSIGAVSYQVRGCFASSGNYGLSDEVSAVISVDCVTVSDLDTGAVLPLPYSDSAHRATSRQTMRSVQLVQLSGRRYPVAERSEAYSDSIDVACLFYRSEDCAALEALVGHMVNVKTPEGWMVSGCLSGLSSRADGGFFTTYTFTVTQTDMEEVIDIDA